MTPEQLLRHIDEATPWPAGCGVSVAEGYERALGVRQLRIRRGEQPRGYKTGFTNRTIWERYGVYAPIRGPSGTRRCPSAKALAHFLAALRDCPGAPDLQPGDVVTTGTWTDAWPVHRGEQWRAAFAAPLSLRFT